MLNITGAEKDYLLDPTYHAIVDSMIRYLEDMQVTPSEMRSMAMLACLKFEQNRTSPSMRGYNAK
jgi:hypothetical protein